MLANFFRIFENFRFSDLIDILVVSFILYKFLSILRGTRAVRVLVGLLAMAILYWVSLSLEFYSLNWFLKHFFDNFFVITIILFQEQLRSGLANFGKTNYFFRRTKSLYYGQIEEVVAASFALSKEKTGGIIVFEKSHGLLNFSSTGTKLDCKIHSDILYTIFQTNSPLHDGAVILFQDRIQAAGCFLPLSKNIEIDRQYGTRHRAALGISEVTDAVVVVVSEETGNVSLCANGEFIICERESDLRRALRNHLISEKDYKTYLDYREGSSV